MKVLAAVLFMATMAVGGYAIHLSRQVEASNQQVAELQARLQEREAALAAAIAARAPIVVAATAEPAEAARAAPAPTPSVPSTPARPAADAVADLTALMRAQQSSPEYQARAKQTMRMLMATTYPDLGEAVGLSPDQASRLIDLLAEHQDRSSSVFRIDAAGNSSASQAERAAAIRELQLAQDAELRSMLGSNYDRYKDYRETLPVWRQRNDLRAVLDAAGSPLTDSQSRSLVAALSVEQRSFNQQTRASASQGAAAPDVMFSQNSPERRERLLNIAAAYLNPQQLEGYKGLLERAAAQEQTMRNTFLRAQPQAPASSPSGN